MAEPIKPSAPSESRLRTGDEDSGLLPRRVIFGNPERCVVRISPDGTRIAFLAPVDGVLNLWVAPIDQIDNARPVTAVTTVISAPRSYGCTTIGISYSSASRLATRTGAPGESISELPKSGRSLRDPG